MDDPVIDALDRPHPEASLGTRWACIADTVMGGVSSGTMAREMVAGRPALRLRGTVSLDNNGGFVQMALDLAPAGGLCNARRWQGIALTVRGNGERYGVHLRSADTARPWQSWRAAFVAGPDWTTHRLPFAAFAPHRIEAALDTGRLRRLGIVAIGRAFAADVALADLRFY